MTSPLPGPCRFKGSPPGAHHPAAAHLEHQLAGKVEEGDNPAPVEVAVRKHFGRHSEKDLAGGVCVHSRDHPAGKGEPVLGRDQAERGNSGSHPILKIRKLRPKAG